MQTDKTTAWLAKLKGGLFLLSEHQRCFPLFLRYDVVSKTIAVDRRTSSVAIGPYLAADLYKHNTANNHDHSVSKKPSLVSVNIFLNLTLF
ncbi:hypothetical protein EDM57_07215 [Brevibacillus gelatini]|uniref:Uncharacterized protein n=1 Tax=Brevibacillus gelatini TaxID=1655277 RepID=A0A3M8B697_9BACL|nr:hypothetical protein EDM57_07215 [Brevibacillus gelatini]